ncbi:hypothetical protein GA0070616_1132 [Micromonospora nigra]|uniref:CopC domain-containing protein n=1 Tax=Micromonospora nigra TaxID=145857 RepID=A0A1C6RIJ7_9ACTN|nr:copper resistance CopC family protein [Micromonospora nigra]SCL16833.1 hypothetical protein GA0070616_1132 [Micromonospora nigra]
MSGRVARAARTWPVVLGVLLAAAAVLLPAAPAVAHNALTGSDPRDGARVATAPQRIELRFLARADPATTKVTVTGPDNVAAAGGPPTVSGNRVSVPFTPGAAGLYIVSYRVVSSDGHPVSGQVRFTLTTGTPAEPASSVTSTPAASTTPAPSPSENGPSEPPATDPDSAVGSAGGGEPAGRGWWWAAGGGVALIAVLAGGFLLRRRRARR